MTFLKYAGLIVLVLLVLVLTLIGILSVTRSHTVKQVMSEGDEEGPPHVRDPLFAKSIELYTGTHIDEGNWVDILLDGNGTYPVLWNDLAAAKNWSVKKNVPIFLGEFGSYSLRPTPADRCRHAAVIYSALGRLDIPNAWWEWDAGFSMFEKGTTRVMDCMRKAVDSYHTQRAGK